MTSHPPIPQDLELPDLWVDEAIWGHRLYDEQTPWMTLLEMLNVLSCRVSSGGPYEDPDCAGVRYSPPRRLALRNVLFNNPYLEDVMRRRRDDEGRWLLWLEKMKSDADGLGESPDFGYLRQVFTAQGSQSESFRDFAEVVNLLCATAIEGGSNKRWTSKFVFPYGPACLFPDLRVDFSMDRRFFGRTGELIYLMLCRSERAEEVFSELRRCMLNREAPWNRLVERLQPPATSPLTDRCVETRTGYLPFRSSPEFTALADDMLVLLRTNLPGYDVLPHLVDLIGLHLILYLLRRAAEWTVEEGEVRLVLEIIAPRKTKIRDLAAESYQANGRRTAKAVRSFIARQVGESAAWRDASAVADPDARREAMREALWNIVRWKEARPDAQGATFQETVPDLALEQLQERAIKRHDSHLGEAHGRWAHAIGLASKRGARRLRYAPSDQLLKTIVLTIVPGERMEYQRFLEELWRRYRMIIGHLQAQELCVDGESDIAAFTENARRLESRLASLGLLRRLSDACAYVENPMGGPKP